MARAHPSTRTHCSNRSKIHWQLQLHRGRNHKSVATFGNGRRPPSSAFSYPMSPAGCLSLDLNGESPVQRTASPRSSLRGSRSTRRAVRFGRGALQLPDPFQSQACHRRDCRSELPVRRALGAGQAAVWDVIMRAGRWADALGHFLGEFVVDPFRGAGQGY